jgi:hypothetical protein
MFFENLNAENRGNVNVLPPSIRRRQCCSFCRESGHNLTTCNSDRLREFEVICATQVLQTNTQDDFKNWLIQNYMSEELLIKTFTIKKFRITARESVERCIDLITTYIFMIYKNTNEDTEIVDNENQFVNDLTTFMQDLSHYREEIREPIPEIDVVRGMERMLMREVMMSRIEFVAGLSIRLPTNLNNVKINKKLNILSSIEHNDNEDITKICECSICYDEKELKNFVKLGCNHEFCKDCLITTMKTSQINDNNLSCALCRTEVKSVKSRTEQAHTDISELIA